MKNISPIVQAHLAMSAVALLYGANYSIAKVVLDDNYIQPYGFILLRILGAGALIAVLHFLFIKEKIEKEDYARLFLCGLFGAGINMLCFFKGLKETGAINASLMMIMTPILVLITSSIFIKEKITGQKLLGIAIGTSGAAILIIYGKKIAYTSAIGDVFVLLNALSYGIYLVLVKKLMTKYHPITVIKWVLFFGFFVCLPFGYQDMVTANYASMPTEVWLSIIYVVIGATFFTYVLNVMALRTVNPSVVSIYIYLQPLIAAIIALSMGKDQLSGMKIFAASLIFSGVYLVSKKNKVKKI